MVFGRFSRLLFSFGVILTVSCAASPGEVLALHQPTAAGDLSNCDSSTAGVRTVPEWTLWASGDVAEPAPNRVRLLKGSICLFSGLPVLDLTFESAAGTD